VAAALVFAVAAAWVYAPVWERGADHFAPVRPESEPGLVRAARADVIFEAWLVSRHAKTLPTRPQRLFDTEHCAPAEHTLALGIPMITLGALAIPAWWLTGDPILTYNVVLVLLSLLGAAAMYALVVSWTGVPAAGIAAGLLYAFHPIRLTDITHPSVWDATWTLFALLFAERWFARGRWRDALGLSAATLLQIGASFYTLLAASFATPPFLVWLLLRDRLRHVRPAQIAFVLTSVALGAALLLGPYLRVETGTTGGGLERSVFHYARWDQLAPGGWLFPGWLTLALAGFALLAPRAWLPWKIRGDPRWALLIGALLSAGIALGSTTRPLPNLHAFFASFLPGLDAVRVVLRVYAGPHLVMALLAGLGAAALVQLARRTGTAAAAALSTLLVLGCAVQVLGAPALGIPRPYTWGFEEIRIEPEEIAFFQELARRGNAGPLLELPLDQTEHHPWVGPPRILMTLFHGRRTSACFGSYTVKGRKELQEQVERLPAPEAVAAIAAQGFTTVIFRHGLGHPAAFAILARLGKAAERGQPGIEHIYSTAERSAFAISAPRGASLVP
jgi:hypothetical protein